MKVGYIRVSKEEQNLDLQRDAMKKAECDKVFEDKITGATEDRPGWEECLKFLRPGDILVIWKLDRAGRNLKHLIELSNELAERNVQFVSLTDHIDTTTPAGMLYYQVMGAVAEFERRNMIERTNAGLEAARARGRVGGRPRKIKTTTKMELVWSMHQSRKYTGKEICEEFGISKATLHRYIKRIAMQKIA